MRIRHRDGHDRDINLAALVKDSETYVFLFDDANAREVLRQLGRFAVDPDLSFTWYDVAVVAQKIDITEATGCPAATDESR
jgi:hypothetical protein